MDIIESDHFYHIYNRANGKINIFESEENYFYFLNLLRKHINPIGEIYSYCLLPNHFHLLIKIKDDIKNPSQAFSNLFNAYAKAFNKQNERTGSLFQRPFKRIRIQNETYLKALIIYIHCNPEIHGICEDFSKYLFSSYQAILSSSPTSITRKEVINLFDDVSNLVFNHKKRVSIDLLDSLTLE